MDVPNRRKEEVINQRECENWKIGKCENEGRRERNDEVTMGLGDGKSISIRMKSKKKEEMKM